MQNRPTRQRIELIDVDLHSPGSKPISAGRLDHAGGSYALPAGADEVVQLGKRYVPSVVGEGHCQRGGAAVSHLHSRNKRNLAVKHRQPSSPRSAGTMITASRSEGMWTVARPTT